MIAIIPARGGSKGLPGKNTRLLCGEPLINYTIKAALQSELISRVVVSTDSEEIAKTALSAGAEVPFLRPAELATDDSLAIDAYLYTYERICREQGKMEDPFVVLLPTSPLRNAVDIDNAIRIFYDKQADSVISVTRLAHPIAWVKKIAENGTLQEYFKTIQADEQLANRQVYTDNYIPNGAIYVLRYSLLKCARNYYFAKTYPYIMPRERSVDIDELADFDLADFLIRRIRL